jgi:hypothetical protein
LRSSELGLAAAAVVQTSVVLVAAAAGPIKKSCIGFQTLALVGRQSRMSLPLVARV